MKKTNPWKVSTFVLGGALTLAIAGWAAPNAQAEPQPRMKAALVALRTAQHNLNNATHDKGGHRVAALGHVRKAIEQVEKGIKADNKR